jgi:hypothetical protein
MKTWQHCDCPRKPDNRPDSKAAVAFLQFSIFFLQDFPPFPNRTPDQPCNVVASAIWASTAAAQARTVPQVANRILSRPGAFSDTDLVVEVLRMPCLRKEEPAFGASRPGRLRPSSRQQPRQRRACSAVPRPAAAIGRRRPAPGSRPRHAHSACSRSPVEELARVEGARRHAHRLLHQTRGLDAGGRLQRGLRLQPPHCGAAPGAREPCQRRVRPAPRGRSPGEQPGRPASTASAPASTRPEARPISVKLTMVSGCAHSWMKRRQA